MEQAIYDSAWHHPGMAFLAGLLVAFLLARRQASFITAFGILFLFEILADALCTGALTPVPPNTGLATAVGIVFVILGDFRYFLVIETFARASTKAPSGLGSARAWGAALALAMVVPVVSVVPQKVWPESFQNLRHIFLMYELMMFALVLGLRLLWLPPRLAKLERATAAWLRRVAVFELVQYGLWVSIDVLILLDVPGMVALRIVPNALYYALFVPFVVFSAPRDLAAGT